MHQYPEIKRLNRLLQQFNISIEVKKKKYLSNYDDYILVTLSIGNEQFDLYVLDEYDDLNEHNQALCLCLVLLELENYQDEDDFLTWCSSCGLAAEDNHVRDYYMNLRTIYPQIEKQIGVIESPISTFDFELNAGAIQELRKTNN